jgi:(E)-4-hydroxy-3-methyl-but-2-enyl pyrophosphate reductase
MIDIKIAAHAGYCFGVKRALSKAEKGTKKSGIAYTLGHIIHNPGVVENLKKKNIHAITDIEDLKPKDVLIIRSHGVSPQVIKKLRQMDVDIVDATCPFVKKAQDKAREMSKSCFVVLIGDPKHPEVIGIRDNIEGEYTIINSAAEAADLSFHKRIGVVIQTTQTKDKFISIVSELIFKCDKLVIENTICSTTEQRQECALKIAGEVDMMIIVGGKNSANTRHLSELPRSRGYLTYHIESYKDLDPRWFQGIKSVGISGGASTPIEDVYNVKKYIKSLTFE